MAPGSSRQASPATLGLLRAMETKAVLASYLQFCYWAKWRPRSPGHPERGEGEEVDGGLRLPGLCQPGQRSMGQGWGFTWLLGLGQGSKGLSPWIRYQVDSRSPCGGHGTHPPWGDGLVGDRGVRRVGRCRKGLLGMRWTWGLQGGCFQLFNEAGLAPGLLSVLIMGSQHRSSLGGEASSVGPKGELRGQTRCL